MTTPRCSRKRLLTAAAVSWIAAAVVFVVIEGVAAAAVPSYSYIAQYISVLGVPEWSPRAALMNWAFYLQGGLFLVGTVLVIRAVRASWAGAVFLLLTAVNAVGNGLVGYVHGFSPLWNDGYEWLHGFGAFLAIGGGNAAIVVGSLVVGRAVATRWYPPVGALIGVAGLVIAVMLQTYSRWAPDFGHIGLVERACVYTIMAWQFFTGVVLLIRPLVATSKPVRT